MIAPSPSWTSLPIVAEGCASVAAARPHDRARASILRRGSAAPMATTKFAGIAARRDVEPRSGAPRRSRRCAVDLAVVEEAEEVERRRGAIDVPDEFEDLPTEAACADDHERGAARSSWSSPSDRHGPEPHDASPWIRVGAGRRSVAAVYVTAAPRPAPTHSPGRIAASRRERWAVLMAHRAGRPAQSAGACPTRCAAATPTRASVTGTWYAGSRSRQNRSSRPRSPWPRGGARPWPRAPRP